MTVEALAAALNVDPIICSDLSRLRPPARQFPDRPGPDTEAVLFLDFDGVLHPAVAAPVYFQEIDRLEALLRDHSGLRIVFSTSWQRETELEHLATAFSTHLRDRILGGTVQTKQSNGYGERETTAADWMRRHGRGQPWISMDDDARAFSYRCSRLVWCIEPAFNEYEDELLRQWLRDPSQNVQDLIAAKSPASPREWTVRDAIANVRLDPADPSKMDISTLPPVFLDAISLRSLTSGGNPLEFAGWRKLLVDWRKWNRHPLT